VPFCHLTFLTARPVLRPYERTKVPAGTLGATFRECRWSRGLDQMDAAAEVGVSVAAYCGWENNLQQPDLRNIPAANRFLGFDWRLPSTTLGDRIRRARTAAGLSITQLAALLEANPSTICGWETGQHEPSKRCAVKLEKWLSRRARSLTTS
jgi:transcriptional regulator with XRE-family HTH domain